MSKKIAKVILRDGADYRTQNSFSTVAAISVMAEMTGRLVIVTHHSVSRQTHLGSRGQHRTPSPSVYTVHLTHKQIRHPGTTVYLYNMSTAPTDLTAKLIQFIPIKRLRYWLPAI